MPVSVPLTTNALFISIACLQCRAEPVQIRFRQPDIERKAQPRRAFGYRGRANGAHVETRIPQGRGDGDGPRVRAQNDRKNLRRRSHAKHGAGMVAQREQPSPPPWLRLHDLQRLADQQGLQRHRRGVVDKGPRSVDQIVDGRRACTNQSARDAERLAARVQRDQPVMRRTPSARPRPPAAENSRGVRFVEDEGRVVLFGQCQQAGKRRAVAVHAVDRFRRDPAMAGGRLFKGVRIRVKIVVRERGPRARCRPGCRRGRWHGSARRK